MSIAYRIEEDDLSGAAVAGLLRLHLDEMHQWSPADSVHAMPIERLRGPDVTFWTAWDADRIAACGALREIAPGHGEIKSMRAHPDYRGRGAGKAILRHMIALAGERGYRRLSLETGSPDAFLPARRLYAGHGFSECGPFGDYVFDSFSIYMTLTLEGDSMSETAAGGITLRPATDADVPALSRLGIDSFVDKFGDLYRPEDLAAFLGQTHSEAAVAREIADPDRLYCLAESAGALVGYCKLGLRCGFPEHARGSHAIELKQLYTAPGHTGRGLGRTLLEWAIAEAQRRGADEMQLSVYSGNDGAQRFYSRHGFAKVADITFAVGEQIDEEFLFAKML